MTHVHRYLRWACRWVRDWFLRSYRTMVVEEALPERLERRTVYIVREGGFAEQAALVCPCGCGAVLHMNLLPDDRPCWRVTRNFDGTVTLYPSIHRKKGCRSHFWLRNGQIRWSLPALRRGFAERERLG